MYRSRPPKDISPNETKMIATIPCMCGGNYSITYTFNDKFKNGRQFEGDCDTCCIMCSWRNVSEVVGEMVEYEIRERKIKALRSL